jgi:hypothetical protein
MNCACLDVHVLIDICSSEYQDLGQRVADHVGDSHSASDINFALPTNSGLFFPSCSDNRCEEPLLLKVRLAAHRDLGDTLPG